MRKGGKKDKPSLGVSERPNAEAGRWVKGSMGNNRPRKERKLSDARLKGRTDQKNVPAISF